MHFKFLVIPSILFCHIAGAQNTIQPITVANGTTAAPVSAAPTTPAAPPAQAISPTSPEAAASPKARYAAILDYKSVYEAPSVEEEVSMATERFSLTEAQQDVWMNAATERRGTEKVCYDKLNSKNQDFMKSDVYMGLRSAHNTFHETIIGYLTPNQKQSLDLDRQILAEKQRRVAQLPPPPPPPAPTVTVAPVDSTAIKAEMKAAAKKSKKSRKKG